MHVPLTFLNTEQEYLFTKYRTNSDWLKETWWWCESPGIRDSFAIHVYISHCKTINNFIIKENFWRGQLGKLKYSTILIFIMIFLSSPWVSFVYLKFKNLKFTPTVPISINSSKVNKVKLFIWKRYIFLTWCPLKMNFSATFF